MIEVKNISHTYMAGTPFAKKALNDVSFTWREGEKLALIGACGSGKSTLLSHLAGLSVPTSGEIIVDGTNINAELPPFWHDFFGRKKIRIQAAIRAAKQKVGLAFQYAEQQLFEETVFSDVAFGAKQAGIKDDDPALAAMVKEALAAVDLPLSDEFAACSPFALSGGQMRRVAIAGILIMRPKYLLLDEPTAGLDPKSRHALMQQIKKFAAKNKTAVLIVTHSMNNAAEFAERIVVMNKGKIALNGPPRDVFQNRDVLAAAALKPPPITSLLAKLRVGGLAVDDTIIDFAEGMTEILTVCGKKRI